MRAAALSALVLLCTACVDETTTPCPTQPAPAVAPSKQTSSFDPKAVETMMKHARESNTDALVVMQDGKLVIEDYFTKGNRPICLMSATKSITNLAIGALFREHPRLSLDTPIVDAWPTIHITDERKNITLRHLMSHTSGLASERSDWSATWNNGHPGVGDHFWKLPMPIKVGEDFRYNNPAVDFLAVYTLANVHSHIDDFLQWSIFGPVGVRGAFWQKDMYGNPWAAGSLHLQAVELAKLGQLALQDGVWEGKRLLPEGWIAMSTKPSQSFNETYGLLWWLDGKKTVVLSKELLDRYEGVGVPSEIVAKLRALEDRVFTSESAWWAEREKLLTRAEQTTLYEKLDPLRVENYRIKLTGPVRAFYASGHGGQYLLVVPSKKLVAVRMHEMTESDWNSHDARHVYSAFVKDVRALVGDLED